MKQLPWLEIILVAILVIMIVAGVSALFGRQIRSSVDAFCTANELWCAPPTPTLTITPTPTNTPRATNTPRPTRTPRPTETPSPTPERLSSSILSSF